MLPNQHVEVSWQKSNKDHYESKGYTFTKYNYKFLAHINDVSNGCHSLVLVICDYCYNEKKIKFCRYAEQIERGIIKKYACGDCKSKKIAESNLKKHGYKIVGFKKGVSKPSPNKGKAINQVNKIPFEIVKEYIEKNNKNTLLTPKQNYLNTNTILDIRCGCGHVYYTDFEMYKHKNTRCNKCYYKKSRGIIRIEDLLDTYGLRYETEFYFDQCKNKRKLPFDVYLNDHVLIEFDGEHHFRPINYNGINNKEAVSHHLRTIIHDKIKNVFCIENNIPLIRIPFWEKENLEKILKNILGYFNLIHKKDVQKKLVYKYLVNHPSWSHDEYLEQSLCNKKKELVTT